MIWLALCVIVITFFVLNAINTSNFWKKRKIVYKHTWPVVGSLKDVILRRKNLGYVTEDLYKEYPDKRYYGTSLFMVRCLVVKDLDLIKRITVKDFDHFVDHINIADTEQEPVFGKILVALKGEKWRDMRNTLSPSFTGNKIRIMFNLISDCAKQFNDHFLAKNEEIIEVEAKDLMTRIAIDIIATTAFGIQCNSIEEDNEFYKMGTTITKASVSGFIRAVFQLLFPKLAKKLNVRQMSSTFSKFFEDVIKETLKNREENKIVRPDMIHILLEASNRKEVTINEIIAQGFLFFLAGFETVSTLLAHTIHELIVNPDVQEKLQTEIDAVFENLDYEVLVKMKYLDMVISETLRKWPPAPFINRECVREYKIESSETHGEDAIIIEKGMGIIIPTFGIQRDPKYYPNPDKFDPERFNDENKHKINPYVYHPFGIGPRNCIGSRLALLETKLLLVYLLSKFDLVAVEKTQIPLVLSPKKPGLLADHFWIGLKKRKL